MAVDHDDDPSLSPALSWPDPLAEQLYDGLMAHWGEREIGYERRVIDAVVWGMLSQRTNYANQRRAYDTMRARFPSWEELAHADLDALEEAISSCTYPEVKAPAIQALLQQVQREHPDFDLEHLRQWSTEDAYRFLTAFKGVGPKTASMTLLFYMRKPILPVDTHVSRVCRRYGLIPPRTSDAKAHKLLNAMMPNGDAFKIYNFHRGGFQHGQKICTYSAPRCNRCPLFESCARVGVTGALKVD